MFSRLLNNPTLSLLVATSVLSIMLLGGCPAAQTPTIPAQQAEDQTAQDPPTTPDNDLDRPIQPPDLDTTTTTTTNGGTVSTGPSDQTQSGGGTGGGDDGGNGGDGSGQDQSGLVLITVDQPAESRAVRPGTVVNLAFSLLDLSGSVANGHLLLAADADGNGMPDGDPVLAVPFAIVDGANFVPFDTQEAVTQGLLTNGFGRFVLGVRATTTANEQTTVYSSATIAIDAIAPTVEWDGAGPDGGAIDKEDHLVNRNQTWTVQLRTGDNSPHTWRVLLDPDLNPLSGNEYEFIPEQAVALADAGMAVRTPAYPVSLLTFPAGTYYFYVVVSDGVDPTEAFYASGSGVGSLARLAITKRLIGEFDLADIESSNQGAVLQGFNFNDLAGGSMVGLPDIDGDGSDELVVVSRFGKPRLEMTDGVGWGEAYLVLGQAQRLSGITRLNAVGNLAPGQSTIEGLVFTGIRCPTTTSWTEGISDVTYVPDMDGDDLPDLVFSFPRVESISLRNPESAWQSDDMGPYHMWMGALEYDPLADRVDTVDIPDPNNAGEFLMQRSDFEVDLGGETWLKNRTQFTRGGIVLISSSTTMLHNRTELNSKGDRIIDLHETGQVFSGMSREDDFVALIEDSYSELKQTMCEGTETQYEETIVYWDVLQSSVGPIGFDNWITNRSFQDALNPPLANMWSTGISLYDIDADYLVPPSGDPCEEPCVVVNTWLSYTPCNGAYNTGTGSQFLDPVTGVGYYIHTGFSGAKSNPEVSPWWANVGARVLGQRVNDRFGSEVSADGTWLYMSAPDHSARRADVPGLDDEALRDSSGVVYQYRTYSPGYAGGPTRSQLWIEAGMRTILDPNNPDADPEEPNSYIEVRATWPYPDIHRPTHEDFPMPLPHTYIIEDVGSHRGRDLFWRDELLRLGQSVPEDPEDFEVGIRTADYPQSLELPDGSCAIDKIQPANETVTAGVRPMAPCESAGVWPSGGVGSSNWYTSRTPQIVGPHEGAKVSFVRAVGDVDDDGVEDFAVGSEHVKSDIVSGTGAEVGAIFIVYGRPTGLEGNYLLEELAYDVTNLDRLAGVVFKGSSANEKLARVFDGAGNFNGSGGDDVVVGNEAGSGGRGEAIVLLGSATLLSPGGGWTVDQAVAAGDAIHFIGENVGDLAGANVASAGDVDGDGFGDVLIAAPGYDRDPQGQAKGAVYLIYGSPNLAGGEAISLSDIGTVDLPGVRFVGREHGDALGGGVLAYGDGDGGNPNGDVFLNPDQTPVDVFSDGVVSIGDLDGDGKGDIAISAMLADPLARRDAGEIYVIYGSGD